MATARTEPAFTSASSSRLPLLVRAHRLLVKLAVFFGHELARLRVNSLTLRLARGHTSLTVHGQAGLPSADATCVASADREVPHIQLTYAVDALLMGRGAV